MYTLVKVISARDRSRTALSLGVALVIAESLYRFQSFTLECLAFLATWYLLDAIAAQTTNVERRKGDDG